MFSFCLITSPYLFPSSYDAEVLEEHQKSLATIVIAQTGSSSPSREEEGEEEEGEGEEGEGEEGGGASSAVQTVTADWVWGSLKRQQQLPVEKYLVK